jgi:hypothetical protein
MEMLTFAKCADTTLGHFDEGELQQIILDSMRVLLTKSEHGWFAQAVEIYHFAEGATEEEAKENFAQSLTATIRRHIDAYKSVEKLMVKAPTDVTKNVWRTAKHMKFSGIWRATLVSEPALPVGDPVRRLVDSVFSQIPSNLAFYKQDETGSSPQMAMAG